MKNMKPIERRPVCGEVPLVGERILSGLAEFEQALEKGVKISKHYVVRTVELDLDPQEYTGKEVRRVREEMRVSQAIFAQLMGVSIHAVRSWEQDKRDIPKIARRLLDEIRANPERWIAMLHENGRQSVI